MIGKVNKSGGGLNINGIIEEYTIAAGENISAGDFVTYINSEYKRSIADTNGYKVSACSLENDKIFITYTDNSAINSSYLYCVVGIIDGNNVSFGDVVSIGTTAYYNESYPVYINNIVYVVSNYNKTSNSGTIHINKFNVEGTEITKVGSTYSTSGGNDIVNVSEVNNYIYIFYCSGSYNICRVYDTTQNDIILYEYVSNGSMTAVLISNNLLFITNSYSNQNYLEYTYYNIDRENPKLTKITAGQLSTTQYSGQISSISMIDDNRLVIFHTNNSYSSMYAMICEITSTRLNYISDTSIVSTSIYGMYSCQWQDKIVIAYHQQYKLNLIECSINDSNVITVEKKYGSIGYAPLLSISNNNNNLIITSILSNSVSAMISIILAELGIHKINSKYTNASGIAQQSGSAGDTIKVIVPNF